MPNEILKETFKILYNGLNFDNVELDYWMQFTETIQKDAIILYIMKGLGKAIHQIPDANIVAIVGDDGLKKMKLIADSLNGS